MTADLIYLNLNLNMIIQRGLHMWPCGGSCPRATCTWPTTARSRTGHGPAMPEPRARLLGLRQIFKYVNLRGHNVAAKDCIGTADLLYFKLIRICGDTGSCLRAKRTWPATARSRASHGSAMPERCARLRGRRQIPIRCIRVAANDCIGPANLLYVVLIRI